MPQGSSTGVPSILPQTAPTDDIKGVGLVALQWLLLQEAVQCTLEARQAFCIQTTFGKESQRSGTQTGMCHFYSFWILIPLVSFDSSNFLCWRKLKSQPLLTFSTSSLTLETCHVPHSQLLFPVWALSGTQRAINPSHWVYRTFFLPQQIIESMKVQQWKEVKHLEYVARKSDRDCSNG